MALFLQFLRTVTLGACLTGALILAIRLGLRRWLTAKARYYLWLLLALRLVLPVVPQSPISLQNLWASPAPATETTDFFDQPFVLPGNDWAPTAEAPAAVSTESVSPVRAETVEAAPVSTPTVAAPVQQPISVGTVLFWVWLMGVGLVLLIHTLRYAVTHRRLKKLPDCQDPDTLRVFLRLRRACGIHRTVRLVLGGGGMLGGLLHPTIVIPAERHREDVGPILLHELMHLKARDLWLLGLYRLLTAVFWFHPMVWLGYHFAAVDSEAACDQRVLESGLVTGRDYARLLYEEGVLTMQPSLAASFGFGRSHLKTRIRDILAYRKPRLYMTVLAAVLALAVVGCTMTDPVQKAQEEPLLTLSEYEAAGDLDGYIARLQTEYGRFGETFEENVAAGCIDPEKGSFTTEEAVGGIHRYATTLEISEKTFEAEYVFLHPFEDQDLELLANVYIFAPEADDLQWPEALQRFWDTSFGYDSEVLGNAGWHSDLLLRDVLTDSQQTALAKELSALPDSQYGTVEDAVSYIVHQTMFSTCYDYQSKAWVLYGLGIALYRAAQLLPEDAASDGWVITPDYGKVTETISPFAMDGELLSFRDVPFDATPTEAEALLGSGSWTMSLQNKPVIHWDAPYPDHPEVKSMDLRFSFRTGPMAVGLYAVEITYDPELLRMETLVGQRTEALGQPDDTVESSRCFWYFGPATENTPGTVTLTLQEGRSGLTEALYDNSSQNLSGDLGGYLASLQGQFGHFGETYAENVAAGCLDPSNSTLTEDNGTFRVYTTTLELDGETLPAEYVFSETLVSDTQVLTEILLPLPEGVSAREWAKGHSDGWSDTLYQNNNAWFSPVMLSSVLTGEQQEKIISAQTEQNGVSADEARSGLGQWPLFSTGFSSRNMAWTFNGTGMALYLAVQD